MALDAEVKASSREQELEATCRRLQRKLAAKEQREADLVEAVYQAAKDAALIVGTPNPIPRPERDRRRSPLHALLHLTDWQLGKKTETYDLDIGVRRVREAVARAVKITEIERADHPVRVCHIMFGGDHVEGLQIFPGQAWEVEGHASEQLFTASGLMEEVILTALEVWEEVHVWWVPGNHGRLGRRGDYPRLDNLDAMACRIAQGRTRDLPRLTWHDPQVWFAIVEAGEYRALLVHGDQMPRTVPAIMRKANQWAAGVMPRFDDIFYGHIHSELVVPLADGRSVFVTPSVETSNEFAREVVAGQSVPAQRLHFVDPKKGRRASERLLFVN